MGLFDIFFRKDDELKSDNLKDQHLSLNTDAMRYSEEGFRYYYNKDFYSAVVSFSKSINASPKSNNFYRLRGSAYEEMKNEARAEEDYRKALDLYPADYIAAYKLGMLFFRKKNLTDAVKWLKASFEHSSEIETRVLGLGNSNLTMVGKQIIAEKLGNFLIQLKQFEEGIYYLDQAIRCDPNYARPYLAKGMALAQMGVPEKGIPYVREAAKLNLPHASEALRTLEALVEKKISQDQANIEFLLDFVFHSSHHIRYENGVRVSGPHGGRRAIKVETNIENREGFIVRIFNTQGNEVVSQMTPKQMKIQSSDSEKIELRGFGVGLLGKSLSDYGLSIFYNAGEIQKIIFHMFDRQTDIEYLPV